ncbi:PKD domain-containing protein [Tamlana haliotis]|uniref:PKD domain-containing protein n=1 Tax=Pseudotamlana haliotis TaxID=2614804 RepID=A0A6N6ME49_9FLAO|nr:PKD domain-containing protein [Tamlana haliotis]KAB1068019.1 PKD domain-containing protein [Tamlana haliotis]
MKIYKLIKNQPISSFALLVMFLGLVSCYDDGYEPYEPPTGNINGIQPNTQFTTSLDPDNTLAVVFRSYSTDAASYSWDFGDGNTSSEANPNYVYADGGLYDVKLTTVSSDGLKAVDSTQVGPLLVDYDYTTVDSEVTFNNLSSGASSLVWDFGDDTVLEWAAEDGDQHANFSPVHTYKDVGPYQATLTVTNFTGDEYEVTQEIDGLVLSTIPDFTFDVNGLVAEFTDASTLAVSHSWDFGDGNTSTDLNPTHTYAVADTYEVTLTTTNDAGVAKSITQFVPVGAVKPTFKAIVLNGTGDEYQTSTGDNADAWDMTPNSTVIDDVQGEIPSPYAALWNNSALNDYIDATYGTNEQPGSTSDGNYVNGVKTRGVKLYNSSRRLYQKVKVEPGVQYEFTIESRSEVAGLNTEIFILNNEITTEAGIDADPLSESDAYYEITNDFNADKPSAGNDTFTTNTFLFEASGDFIVIYVRALDAVDSSNEVFFDNIDINTPGF